MTENLKTALHGLADHAPPVSVPDDLWADARRARRRDLVVVPVLALLLVIGVGLGIWLAQPDEAYDPQPVDGGRDALPSELHHLPSWMNSAEDFPGETDLSLGRVSVAFTTIGGRPVLVTADDGVHHLVKLPGFEESPGGLMDESTSLSVSPDGRRLAWSWHGELPDADAQARPVPSGLRIGDLLTGEIETFEMTEGKGVQLGNFGWSPDGRYLAFSKLVLYRFHDGGRGGRQLEAERLDLETGARVVLPRSMSRLYEPTFSVSSRGDVALASNENQLAIFAPDRQPHSEQFEVRPTASPVSWASALWTLDGRSVVIAPLYVPEGRTRTLDMVDAADFERGDGVLPATQLRELDRPARLLGQVDDEWVLAMEGHPFDGRLVMFPIAGDLGREPVVVSEFVKADPEATSEMKSLTAAWQLVEADRPNRDFPAPDWPDEPADRLRQAMVLGGALLLCGVGALVWWRRPRRA